MCELLNLKSKNALDRCYIVGTADISKSTIQFESLMPSFTL